MCYTDYCFIYNIYFCYNYYYIIHYIYNILPDHSYRLITFGYF